jgi:hypothetical protein
MSEQGGKSDNKALGMILPEIYFLNFYSKLK